MRPSTAPPDGETRCRARLTFGFKDKILLIAPLASLAPGDVSPMCPSSKALATGAELEIKKRAALESAQGQTLGLSTRGTDFYFCLLSTSILFCFPGICRHIGGLACPILSFISFHFIFLTLPREVALMNVLVSKLAVIAFLVD